MVKKLIIFANIVLMCLLSTAQEKSIGSWTDHLSYDKGTSITTDGEKVYCGTNTGYFIYNTKDNSIEVRSKVNGLSEVNIIKIEYIPTNDKLLVVYGNGNIDLIHRNKVITLPFIKESIQISDKNVNDIYIDGVMAYISFDFGIIVLDTEKNEIKETFNVVGGGVSKKINGSTIKNDIVYAATTAGVYIGNLNDNLLDFNNWSLLPQNNSNTIKNIFKFQDEIYAVIKKGNEDVLYKIDINNQLIQVNNLPIHTFVTAKVINEELIYLSTDTNYIFDSSFSLLSKFTGQNNSRVMGLTMVNNQVYRVNDFSPMRRWDRNGNLTKHIRPFGPATNILFDMDASQGELWTVNGGYDFTMNNSFNYISINRYTEGTWINYNNYNSVTLDGVYDAVSVYLHPEEKGHAYISTWSKGLFEFNKSSPFKNYNTSNSPLTNRKSNTDWLGVSGAKLDDDENLWMINTHVPSALVVKRRNGSWESFDFSPEVEHENRMSEIEITKGGNIWVALDRRNEILVFDHKNTLDNKADDEYIVLSAEKGKGSIPGIRGLTFALDKVGQMWIGTSAGLVVHYSPDRVFDPNFRDLEEILIDDGENIEVLLKGTTINTIAVDGANNKWIGTENSGVYQLSPDGKKELQHFTFENSPLISNQIISIAIDHKNGEVFFGTGLGIVSFKSSIINAKKDFNEFKVYPNPVNSNYNGPIGISGLMENSTVKITDISGKLVNEFYSEGGQVIWNGQNMRGEKVSSGVYLVMNSAEDGFGNLETKIGKILFLK